MAAPSSNTASAAARQELRAAWDTVRLSKTIEHAYQHVRHYREVWRARNLSPASFSTLADIRRFPVTTKASIAADPTGFLSDAETPEAVHDTSGTTGRRLAVYSNSAEDREMATLLAERSAGAPRPSLVLRLLPPPRRLATPRSGSDRGPGNELRLPILPGYDPGVWVDAVDQVANVVFEDYYVGGRRVRVDVIHATPPPLLHYVTEQLGARGVDLHRTQIQDLLLTGGFAPRAVRRMLEERWNARVATAFSCTEIRGDFPECPLVQGRFHPSPSVYAEVLDPAGHAPVPDGCHGVLALTGLHPYQRVMPVIRYLTGDIAEFSARACPCGAAGIGFRIVGRSASSVEVSEAVGRSHFVGSNVIEDAIDGSPHVPCFPYPRMFASSRTGGDRTLLEIDIEASCPASFDAAAEASRIRARLLDLDQSLARACAGGRLKLDVALVEKGALAQYFRLYPGR